MQRVLFELPGLGWGVPSFNLLLAVACIAALGLTAWRARLEGIAIEQVFGLAAWLMGGGILGARVLYIVAHPETVRSPLDVIRVWNGGIIYYGCLIGGLIGSTIYWLRRPFPFRAMADAVAPSLALGSAIGRVGCHLNGCCFGGPTELPWAVRFPAGSIPWGRQVDTLLISPLSSQSLPVHPTQLYAVADGLAILAFLTWVYPKRRRDGEVMAWLMVTYPVTRFVIECLRVDEPRLVAGLTMSQIISLLLFAAGLVCWVLLDRQPVSRHADRRTSDAQPVEANGVLAPELSLVDSGPV